MAKKNWKNVESNEKKNKCLTEIMELIIYMQSFCFCFCLFFFFLLIVYFKFKIKIKNFIS